jgi:hypothetical protein
MYSQEQEGPEENREHSRNHRLEAGHVHEVLVGVRNDDADDQIDD